MSISRLCTLSLLENCTAGFENEADRKERREKDDRLADKIEREDIESFYPCGKIFRF